MDEKQKRIWMAYLHRCTRAVILKLEAAKTTDDMSSLNNIFACRNRGIPFINAIKYYRSMSATLKLGDGTYKMIGLKEAKDAVEDIALELGLKYGRHNSRIDVLFINGE